ncbi:MAG TPA: VWA domain-containing protein [Thermoanaerobaculia bacterium]|nr:VWA domain-containing protein [Thermoanaerobaculia bacterium]
MSFPFWYRPFLVAVFLLPLTLSAQDEPRQAPKFEEEIEVNLVLIDAIVTDRQGNQMLGLRAGDFIVAEDGTPMEIDSVDYFTNRRLLTGREEEAAFDVERLREERYFILFFHKVGTIGDSALRLELMRAKQAAQKFIREEILPEDRVAIAGYDFRLKIFSDFSSDKEALVRALDDAVSFANGITESSAPREISIFANLSQDRMVKKTGRIYTAIEALAESVSPIQGRKAMLLYSPGMGEPAEGNRQFRQNDDFWFDPMVHSLNEANVSVYTVNTNPSTEYHVTEELLNRLSAQTGGEHFRALVDYGVALREVENENNGYYLLTYYSRKPRGEHGYQEVEVRLRNPEFRIKAREGYKY